MNHLFLLLLQLCSSCWFAYRSPDEPNKWMVKRLIALQGDWVNVPGSYEILQVPKGRCWVEGDNGSVSMDSRTFGAVSAHISICAFRFIG